MITRQTKLQLIVFAVISVLGLSFTGARYAGLARFFTDPSYRVSADFSDSGGIFSGAEVTYRGIHVGKVGPLTLRPDGVRVALDIDKGTKVPAQVQAVIGNRSAVGEQFVDLEPQTDAAPYLTRGAVIPLAATRIPISPTQLLVNLDDLVNSLPKKDLAVVLDELGTAFQGSGDSLQRLVDAGNQLTQAATQNLPQTLRLIHDSQQALDTQNAQGGEFQSYAHDLRLLATQLRSSDPDFRQLYSGGTDAASQLTGLLDATRTSLPILVDNLVSTAQVQAVRLPALREILVLYPNVVAGGFTVTPGDGTAHFGLVTQSAPPVCKKGYESTAVRLPADTAGRTPNLRAYCADSKGATDIRGAANAPYPAGDAPFPQGGGTGSGSAASTASTSGAGAAAPTTVGTGTYDPSTGQVRTADGRSMTVGSTAGAGGVFGANSWQWLLLGPLSHGHA